MEYVVYFGLGIVVGTVILIVSMIIASALFGGIDFGSLHIVIAKSVPLLALVYAVCLIPFLGWLLAIPIWWGGLMLIFHLDFWEVRTLVLVNWVLNTIARLALFAMAF